MAQTNAGAKRDRKIKIQKNIMLLVMIAIMGFCGYAGGTFLGYALKSSTGEKVSVGKAIGVAFLVLVAAIVAVLLHIYIHETGHLIFGLMSGYKFQSIRFGSLMICKTDGKLKLAKYSVAGTGGQCLMTPPDVPAKDLPTDIYNWGGIFMNILLSAIGGALFFVFKGHPFAQLFMGAIALIGIYMIVMNGIPVEALANDGYNAIHLKHDLKAKNAFKIMLLVGAGLADGKSIKEMPSEWFDWEFTDENESALAVSQGVYRLSWLIANKRIEEAYELSSVILDRASSLASIYQITVTSEKLYCMIVLGMDNEAIRRLYINNVKNIMSLASLPSTQRLLYKYYACVEKDGKKASEARATFEKLAKGYPYPSDIEVERELMDLPCITPNTQETEA